MRSVEVVGLPRGTLPPWGLELNFFLFGLVRPRR